MIRKNSVVTGKLAVSGLFTLAALIVIGGRPAQAQQTEVEAMREQIKALQERLDLLEADQQTLAADAKKVSDATAKAPNVTSAQPIRVTGMLQLRYDSFFNQKGIGPIANDTFRLRRGEIRITAPAITDRIGGTIMFDIARGLFANQSSTTASASFGSNVLQEMQINYLLKKAKLPANNTYIDVGQFKIPLGYEGDLVSSSAIETIERGLIFTARDPFGGGYGDIRDTGIQLRGTLNNQFDYRLGVFNGLGERQNQLATSDNKAIVARLAYRPTSVPGLIVGVSGAKGDTRTTTSLIAPRTNRDAFNVFGAYKKDKVVLQAEYLTGKSLGFSVFPGTAINRKLSGYYGLAGYYFTPQLEGVVRYDYLDTNRGAIGDTDVRDLTLGLNYYLKGNNAKIQANIVRRKGGDNVLITNANNPQSDLRNDRTELRVQTQIAF